MYQMNDNVAFWFALWVNKELVSGENSAIAHTYLTISVGSHKKNIKFI
jgi:hypothetical protein